MKGDTLPTLKQCTTKIKKKKIRRFLDNFQILPVIIKIPPLYKAEIPLVGKGFTRSERED